MGEYETAQLSASPFSWLAKKKKREEKARIFHRNFVRMTSIITMKYYYLFYYEVIKNCIFNPPVELRSDTLK